MRIARLALVSVLGLALAGPAGASFDCPGVLSISTTYPRHDDVAGLVALSSRDLKHLLKHGTLGRGSERTFFPYSDNPHVRDVLINRPDIRWNGFAPAEQGPAALEYAWILTMYDYFSDYLETSGTRSRVDDGQLEALVRFLRPDFDQPGPLFSVPPEDLAQVAHVMDLEVDQPAELPARTVLSRDLKRRLNIGARADFADLRDWSGLRVVAEIFRLPPGSPEDALRKFFSHFPRHAGIVVGLRSRALARVSWDVDDWPSVRQLDLDDVAGVVARGRVELDLLRRWAEARRR